MKKVIESIAIGLCFHMGSQAMEIGGSNLLPQKQEIQNLMPFSGGGGGLSPLSNNAG